MNIKNSSLYFLILGMMAVVFVTALGGGLFGQQASFVLQWQHQAFADMCHQIPGRSFWIGGQPMAVCSRCIGIYSGLLISWLLFPLVGKLLNRLDKYNVALLCGIIFINIIDVIGNFLGFWSNTLISRFVLGTFFSAIIIVLVGSLLLDHKKTIRYEYTTNS